MIKAYLDTNVLVYRLLPSDNNRLQQHTREIFNKCRSGSRLGIISNLTLTEFAGVCQKMEARDIARIEPMGASQRERHVQSAGLANYNRVIPILLSLPNIKFENPSNLRFEDMMADALKIMQETVGTITLSRAAPGVPRESDFRRAYVADVLQVLLAKYVGCDEFYTFDKDIKKLEAHCKITPLKIMKY